MNIFLDTNVVMDYLASRGDILSVRRIFKGIESGQYQAFISIGSYYTITYLTEILLKSKGMHKPERIGLLREILLSLLAYVNIAVNTKEELINGTKDLDFADLEDSYQYQSALAAKCEYIITSNLKDFKEVTNDKIKIILPAEML